MNDRPGDPQTRSLETEYFLRLARVGSVVLVAGVLVFLMLRAQEKARPPAAAAEEGSTLLLLTSDVATENDDGGALDVATELPDLSPLAVAGPGAVGQAEGLVAPRVSIDLPEIPRISAGSASSVVDESTGESSTPKPVVLVAPRTKP